MIITAIGNWQPAPGTLLEWHPTAGAKALAAEGEPHPVGPTFLQQTHVAAYLAKQADGGEHRAFLGVATELDGDLDIVALTKCSHSVRCTARRSADVLRCRWLCARPSPDRHRSNRFRGIRVRNIGSDSRFRELHSRSIRR